MRLMILVVMALIALASPALGAADPTPLEPAALRALARQLVQPLPEPPAQIRGEALTPAKIRLGHQLFFEPRLSRSHLVSCNTCHALGTGGADNIPTSIGHGWQRGPRNAPTVYNAVFNTSQFWDGRAADLMQQAKGPVQTAVEMNNTRQRVEDTLRSMPAYVQAFREAFPDDAKPVTFDNMARAIEAFEATLVTPGARFDRFLEGDDAALDATELEGLSLFIRKGCIACHAGANLGGRIHVPFGVAKRPGADILPENDTGRFRVTRSVSDAYVFRVPPLRNVALTAPYFHSGEVWDLAQAVAIMGTSQMGQELDDEEAATIASFLKTLTGTPPRIAYPQLPPSTATTPRPDPHAGP